MSLNWIDVTNLSFNTLLLLEREQLTWLPGWLPEIDLAIALKANPAVEWYLRNKNPVLNPWVDKVLSQIDLALQNQDKLDVRSAEETILRAMNDLVCYAVDPETYDNLPFLGWDSSELSNLVDFRDLTVVDIGAGTGRLAFIAAEEGAREVFAVEPVGNLRVYMKEKAQKLGLTNVHTMDGLITDLPFPDDFIDIVMAGHVFGDNPEAEYAEMVRVVKPGGMVILCPGNNDVEDDRHQFLVDMDFEWSQFEEPGEGIKRKYWKTL
jgi:SAM-dependent methyltransferase